jgi:cytochrome c-type biogenesis protein CcmF
MFEGAPGEEKMVGTLQPEKRRYVSSAMPMTEAAIDRNLWRDRYVSLGEPLAGEPVQWSFRVYHKPYVSWIWLGAVFMVLGGVLAAWDRRYRQVRVARSAAVGMGSVTGSVTTPVTTQVAASGLGARS